MSSKYLDLAPGCNSNPIDWGIAQNFSVIKSVHGSSATICVDGRVRSKVGWSWSSPDVLVEVFQRFLRFHAEKCTCRVTDTIHPWTGRLAVGARADLEYNDSFTVINCTVRTYKAQMIELEVFSAFRPVRPRPSIVDASRAPGCP